MINTHTPGPWFIRQMDEWSHDIVTTELTQDGEPTFWNVASINGRRDEVNANLRLIAAAPELLEALVRLVRQHGSDGIKYGGDHPIAGARAAIAKATE